MNWGPAPGGCLVPILTTGAKYSTFLIYFYFTQLLQHFAYRLVVQQSHTYWLSDQLPIYL
ncbi:MAG: hypothetical protein PWP31_157 [Clostridia bacterium]|nr:hypothetical protein [Clostridia bacterium]